MFHPNVRISSIIFVMYFIFYYVCLHSVFAEVERYQSSLNLLDFLFLVYWWALALVLIQWVKSSIEGGKLNVTLHYRHLLQPINYCCHRIR